MVQKKTMRTISAVVVVLAVCSVQSQPASAQDTLTIGMENQFGTRVNERDGQMTACVSVMGTAPELCSKCLHIVSQPQCNG